jgi:hypothetical protein
MMDSRELGYEITEIAAGLDDFERKTFDGKGIIDDEGLIPLYLGQDLIRARNYTSWSEVDADIAEIVARIDAMEFGSRKLFLKKLGNSLRSASTLFQGGDLPFTEKLTDLVGVPAESLHPLFIEDMGARLQDKLNQAGFSSGTLREKVSAWEQSGGILPEHLETVFTELMAQAQERTDSMIVDTDGYTMVLNPVRNIHYSARCNFTAGKMDLNMDNTFSRAALKHLVAHECFPGHSTQNIYTLRSFKQGTATADVLLCSLNGITGVIQEGIGDQGVEMIDWIEDINDEIQALLRRYQSSEAHAYMRDIGAMQEPRIRGRIHMARHPFRSGFISSYFYGNEAVRRVRLAVGDDPVRRKAFVAELYGKMHAPESLCLALGVPYRSYGDK